jgi:hypothetical protein
MLTEVLPSASGREAAVLATARGAKLDPKIDKIAPGAMAPPSRGLKMWTAPPGVNNGAASAEVSPLTCAEAALKPAAVAVAVTDTCGDAD